MVGCGEEGTCVGAKGVWVPCLPPPGVEPTVIARVDDGTGGAVAGCAWHAETVRLRIRTNKIIRVPKY